MNVVVNHQLAGSFNLIKLSSKITVSMANPFSDSFDEREEVMEGFLCPICKADFRSPDRLTAHFDTHSEDDQDLLKSFKDIFISAKNKITRFDDTISPNQNFVQPKKLNVPAPVYPQDVGVDCSHIAYFRAIRTPRLERYATETNKLIIRLHKLLTDLPSEPSQRRQHEKNVHKFNSFYNAYNLKTTQYIFLNNNPFKISFMEII